MTETNQNPEPLYVGDYRKLNIPVKDPDGGNVSSTGASCTYTLANSPRDSSPAVSKTDSSSEVTLSEVDGTLHVEVEIVRSDTQGLDDDWPNGKSEETYYHELEVEDAQSNYFTVMTGWWTIRSAAEQGE